MTTHPFPSVLGKTLVGKPLRVTCQRGGRSRARGRREWVREAQATEGREETKQVVLRYKARCAEDFGSPRGQHRLQRAPGSWWAGLRKGVACVSRR